MTALRAALNMGDDAVWLDTAESIHGGDIVWATVVAEITARPIFIVVVSPDAMASPWVNNEINLAWSLKTTRPNRHIIPVVYRECEMRADLEMLLYVSFLSPQTFDIGLAALVKSIRALNEAHPPVPSTPVGVARPLLPSAPLIVAESEMRVAEPDSTPSPIPRSFRSGFVTRRRVLIGGCVLGAAALAGGGLLLSKGGGPRTKSSATAPPLNRLRWRFRANQSIIGGPVVTNDTVYVGSDDAYAYAVKVMDGTQIWAYPTGGRIVSTLAIANGVVYVGSED
ncbi:MAG: PQQ-binding-like beta-propeller repeat protein, partial [Ktedonobacterales bacterium]